MRQRGEQLPIYASDAVREKLGWIDDLMSPFCRVAWRNHPEQFSTLADRIELRAIALSTSSAFEIRTPDHRMLLAPAIPEISPELAAAVKTADTIIFDGTFWSNDELRAIRPGGKNAREMGHLPVKESLPLLREARAAHRIYIHINNTNPILGPDSRERRAVESAGVIVGYDGLEFEV